MQVWILRARERDQVDCSECKADPANPRPGELVRLTALSGKKEEAGQVFFWTTDGPLALTHPHLSQITFLIPSEDVTVTANWTRVK